jgi:hypothetical protein
MRVLRREQSRAARRTHSIEIIDRPQSDIVRRAEVEGRKLTLQERRMHPPLRFRRPICRRPCSDGPCVGRHGHGTSPGLQLRVPLDPRIGGVRRRVRRGMHCGPLFGCPRPLTWMRSPLILFGKIGRGLYTSCSALG